jgi:hypothetical protein
MIGEAQQAGNLLGVCDDVYWFPIRKEKARTMLNCAKCWRSIFRSGFHKRIFGSKDEDEDAPLYFVRPLSLAEVGKQDRLVVVTCNYSLGDDKPATADYRLQFSIAPDTVEFHLFESV